MKAQLIFNPVAGQRDVESDLRRAIALLEGAGWEVLLRRTLGRGDATTYAREAVAQGCDVAIAAGGDGTLGEVATGLAHSDCVLGVLPVGTGNVWAHMLGLPVWTPLNRNALSDAAQVLIKGRKRRIDLGMANGRFFVLWTGIGFDAQVAQDIEPYREIRRNLGNLTYLVTAVALAMGLRGTRVTVSIDGKAIRQRALLIVISNAQLYGHSWRLAPQAQLDDGMLEVYVFKGSSGIDAFRHAGLLAIGRHLDDSRLEKYRARSIEIRADRSLPIHLDGDPFGHTPVTVSVVPKALSVIVPEWASGTLFEDGETVARPEFSLGQRILERLRVEQERWMEEGERLAGEVGRRLGRP